MAHLLAVPGRTAPATRYAGALHLATVRPLRSAVPSRTLPAPLLYVGPARSEAGGAARNPAKRRCARDSFTILRRAPREGLEEGLR